MNFHTPILLLLVSACTGVYSDPTQTTGAIGPTDGSPSNEPVDPPQIVTGNKRMFVTSTTYQGGLLGGLAGADARCAARASASGLAGTYKAWLSDSHKSAASRLTHSTGSYSLIDGTLVAASWDDLVATNLQHAVDLDELGHTYTTKTTCFVVRGVAPVWTRTTPDGGIYPSQGFACSDWTEISQDGRYSAVQVGNILSSDTHWTDSLCAAGCTEYASLYCLEQ